MGDEICNSMNCILVPLCQIDEREWRSKNDIIYFIVVSFRLILPRLSIMLNVPPNLQ